MFSLTSTIALVWDWAYTNHREDVIPEQVRYASPSIGHHTHPVWNAEDPWLSDCGSRAGYARGTGYVTLFHARAPSCQSRHNRIAYFIFTSINGQGTVSAALHFITEIVHAARNTLTLLVMLLLCRGISGMREDEAPKPFTKKSMLLFFLHLLSGGMLCWRLTSRYLIEQ